MKDSERKERIPLPFGQNGEQHEIGLWRDLCSDADFQDDIKKGKQVLGAHYWRDLPELETAAQRLNKELYDACKKLRHARPNPLVSVRLPRVKLRHEREIQRLVRKWGLDDLQDVDRWLEHLLRSWDPDSGGLPSLRMHTPKYLPLDLINRDSPGPERPLRLSGAPIFKAVTAYVESCVPVVGKDSPPKVLRATMTIRPGTSVREAQRAAQVVVKRLGMKPRSHRPGLTTIDRDLLRVIFESKKELIKKPKSCSRVIDEAIEQMKERERPVKRSRVSAELYQWRKQNGLKVRRYHTDEQHS